MNGFQHNIAAAARRNRVLIVDDGAGFAQSVVASLAGAGSDVAVVGSIEAAQAEIAKLLADVAANMEAAHDPVGLCLVIRGADSEPLAIGVNPAAADGPGGIAKMLSAASDPPVQARLIRERDAAESARRESEELLHAILDNATAVIYAKDREGRYLFVNKMFEQIFGIGGDSIKGKMDHEIFPAQAADAFRRNDLDVVHTGQPLEIEEVAPHADGPHSYISVKFPIFGADGAVRGVCGISTDITDRKRAAEQLRSAQRIEAIGHLTGGVAHDFNNLNSVILGNLELIEEELQPGSRLHVMAKRAIEAARRGALLTERLLAFSRRQVLQPQSTDVNALLLATVEFLRRSLGETIEIRTVLAGDAWPAFVDPGQLENAIINLAVNARDAMPNGGVLLIQSRNRELDEYDAVRSASLLPGNYVEITVGDTGTGMTPEVRERAFEPFFTTKEVGKGTGLGLSMVFGFVSQSGGHVQIESEVGRGTIVRLLLPRGPEGAALAAGMADAAEIPVARRGEVILLVEDDAEVRSVAVTFLENVGYRVLQAEDGPSALKVLQDAPPLDLLLTDVALPGGMNGRELAKKVTTARPETRILYMSGHAETGLSQSHLAETGALLMDKPFNRAKIATMVRAAIDTVPCRPRPPVKEKR